MNEQYQLKDVPENIKEKALNILNKDTRGVFYFDLDLALVSKDYYFRLEQYKDNSKEELLKKIDELSNKLNQINNIVNETKNN